MDPRSLVPDLDPLEDRQPGFRMAAEGPAVHQFLLQDRPEALHHRVVVAVARPAHALLHPERREHRPALAARVLHAAVGVVHEPPRRSPPRHRHPQRIEKPLVTEPRDKPHASREPYLCGAILGRPPDQALGPNARRAMHGRTPTPVRRRCDG